jgi:quercetin dioxygenase-like cupin family protein
MPIARKTALILGAATTLVAFGAGVAVGQAQAPTETKGFNSTDLRSLDLSQEIDSIKGRPLRMRKITVQPGGVLAMHTHKGRPAVSYILEGSMTYHQEGRPDTVAKTGDGIAEGRATTHWAENLGSVPAVWIAVDIPEK